MSFTTVDGRKKRLACEVVRPNADNRALKASRPDENFQHAQLCGALQRSDSFGERELFADEALNVNGVSTEQFERGRETSAARADDADLVNDDGRGVEFRPAVEG